MKLPAALLFLMIALAAVLSIAANPGAAAPVASRIAGFPIAQGAAQEKPAAVDAQSTNKQRSRRPARIDLTMPYYRFGRLPIRIKD